MLYERICFVYAIQHNKTKKIYVGSSNKPEERYRSHIRNLKRGEHSVEDMQADFDKYGEDYSFFILEKVASKRVDSGYGSTISSEHKAEYEWMIKLGTTDRAIGYNYGDKNAINYANKRYFNSDIPFTDGVPVPLVIQCTTEQ